MTLSRVNGAQRVLVVSADTRVAGALASLLEALPGFAAHTALGTHCDVEDAIRVVQPHLAVVDVTRSNTARDVRLVRRLARRLPVVAVCDCGTLPPDVVIEGRVSCCDKDGDVDAFVATVLGMTRPTTG